MEKQYIIPVVGQIYTNRNGQEYRCTYSYFDSSDERKQRALALGEHVATMERVKDGWTLDAHGVLEYEDGTIEWNYSTHGYFAKKHK